MIYVLGTPPTLTEENIMTAANGTITYITTPKDCDFCKDIAQKANLAGQPEYTINKAKYDFRTRHGYWANGCEAHWILNRRHETLGIGKGQQLVIAP